MNHYVSLLLSNRKSSVHLHGLYSARTALRTFTPRRDQLVICGQSFLRSVLQARLNNSRTPLYTHKKPWESTRSTLPTHVLLIDLSRSCTIQIRPEQSDSPIQITLIQFATAKQKPFWAAVTTQRNCGSAQLTQQTTRTVAIKLQPTHSSTGLRI
jgi:hypothetical protein